VRERGGKKEEKEEEEVSSLHAERQG